jgi:magnesium-transporting ATPase (P-type)
MLFVSLIIDIIAALAFASEKWDPDNEYEPPKDKLFSGELWRTIITTVGMQIAMIVFLYSSLRIWIWGPDMHPTNLGKMVNTTQSPPVNVFWDQDLLMMPAYI